MKNASIIRHKAKILAAIRNAQKFIQIQDEYGSFERYICNSRIMQIVMPIDSSNSKKKIPESDDIKELKSKVLSILEALHGRLLSNLLVVSDNSSYCWKNRHQTIEAINQLPYLASSIKSRKKHSYPIQF